MEDLYGSYVTYDGILEEVWKSDRDAQFRQCQILRTMLAVIVVVHIVLVGIFVLAEVPLLVLTIPGSLSVIAFLITKISMKYVGKKNILYDIIYPRGVTLFNQEHDTTFTYEFKPKLDKTFHEEMGLFTRFASISSNFRMVSKQEGHAPITIQHCRMVTSNGKSSTIHFDGVYLILPKSGIPVQQLRSNGRPALKGVKMERLEDYEERIYVPQEEGITPVDSVLLGIFQELPQTFELSRQYIGSNQSEIHIALWFKKQPRLPNELNYNGLEELIDPLHKLMSYTVELHHRLEDMYQ